MADILTNMSELKNPNYCHDPEILDEADALGVKNRKTRNLALSVGEATMYGGVERARIWLIRQLEKIKENKLKQRKSRLSDKQKAEILKKGGQG